MCETRLIVAELSAQLPVPRQEHQGAPLSPPVAARGFFFCASWQAIMRVGARVAQRQTDHEDGADEGVGTGQRRFLG